MRPIITGGFTDNELGEAALEANRTYVCNDVMSLTPAQYDPVLDSLIFGSECSSFLRGLLNYNSGFLGPLWTASGMPGNPSGSPMIDAQMLCARPNSNKSGYLNAIHTYMGSSGITQLSGSIFDYCTFTGLNNAFTNGGAYVNMRTDLEVIPGVCGPLYNNFPTRVKNTLYVTPGYNALALLLRQNNGQTFIRRTMEGKHSWGFSTMKQGALANNFTYLKMLDDMFIYLPSELYATIMNDLYGRNGQYQEQLKLQSHNMYGSNRLGVQKSDKLLRRIVYNGVYSSTTGNVTASYTFTNTTTGVKKRKLNLFHGQKRYELTDHLGNVVTTISERRVCDSTGTFSAEVITQTGYEPFGALQAGRQYHADKDSGYRFGFNTQLKTDEILGPGNSYSAEFWQYDARIGRRWNRDPKSHPSFSPYSTMQGNPIWFSDPRGDTIRIVGNANFRIKTLEYMQSLTNDKLLLERDGTVLIDNDLNSENKNVKLVFGTELIRSLNRKDAAQHLVTIKEGTAKDGEDNGTAFKLEYANRLPNGNPNVGNNPIITFNISHLSKSTINEVKVPSPYNITLAHELIHASHAYKGIRDPTIGKYSVCQPNGKNCKSVEVLMKEVIAVDEENQVRSEHSLPKRDPLKYDKVKQ